MEETSAKLAELGNDIKNAEIPMWTGLPILELYMDQVIILLNSYMRIIKDENGESETITKNMINNYVKMKVVPAPVKKKYSRTHIAYLIMVCIMKQIFSISMIKSMLPDFDDEEKIKATYNSFVKHLVSASEEYIEKYSSSDFASAEDSIMKLSSEAIVLKIMAERLV
ncbi:MAG: DUF1836 domain-containing protein [Clostridia bacterium]|nr:DUF1836 domain-containing protein [Clostridia bacterium]